VEVIDPAVLLVCILTSLALLTQPVLCLFAALTAPSLAAGDVYLYLFRLILGKRLRSKHYLRSSLSVYFLLRGPFCNWSPSIVTLKPSQQSDKTAQWWLK
jgi:hypothetical protein